MIPFDTLDYARKLEALGALADAAKGAADRAVSAIDDAMAFIAASNKRIARMESAAKSIDSAGEGAHYGPI